MVLGLALLWVSVAGVCGEPVVYLQLTTHNEQPHVPDTPNFTNFTAQADYIRWRNALKEFGEMCVARGLRYNCQCEWNFLEGVLKWEVRPATAIPGITTNTGNLNILAYLYQLGQTSGVPIEMDPHSHEGGGYTYADVAHLLYQCGVTPAPVVGGHILDDITWVSRDFDRLSAVTGVVATKYATATNWFPALLMGGGTASHVNDPHDAGFWRPASASNFFTHATNGPLAAIGSWQNDLHETGRLIERLKSGEVPAGGRMWTSGLVLNHRDLQYATYRTNEARMMLDTLKSWQDEGRIQTTTYMESLGRWQTNFLEAASLYQRPEDNVSFSLNWQDYFYTNESMAYLDALLDLHESNQVPHGCFLHHVANRHHRAEPRAAGSPAKFRPGGAKLSRASAQTLCQQLHLGLDHQPRHRQGRAHSQLRNPRRGPDQRQRDREQRRLRQAQRASGLRPGLRGRPRAGQRGDQCVRGFQQPRRADVCATQPAGEPEHAGDVQRGFPSAPNTAIGS
jgi:hypothetical protein